MTKTFVLATVLTAVLVPALAVAAPQGKNKRQRATQAQPQIACTVLGCVPVPPGCGQTGGRTWDGNPNGLDVIVCPPGVRPFR